MVVPVYVVDAFSSRPFRGNPAGVCLLSETASEEWMQRVAAEMKHSETAFVSALGEAFNLRWFTPSTEVDLCGHATLASAHVLWEVGRVGESEAICFKTASGDLTCTRHGYGIQLDFPAEPPTEAALPFEIDFGAPLLWAGKNRMDRIVVLPDEEAVCSLSPDLEAIGRLECRGLIVTAQSSSDEYDFVSRFFAPGAGVPEDPVTGSAHCCLGPFWAARLGKTNLVGYQCSPRGGTVRVQVFPDRVLLQGHAVTVLRGELLV